MIIIFLLVLINYVRCACSLNVSLSFEKYKIFYDALMPQSNRSAKVESGIIVKTSKVDNSINEFLMPLGYSIARLDLLIHYLDPKVMVKFPSLFKRSLSEYHEIEQIQKTYEDLRRSFENVDIIEISNLSLANFTATNDDILLFDFYSELMAEILTEATACERYLMGIRFMAYLDEIFNEIIQCLSGLKKKLEEKNHESNFREIFHLLQSYWIKLEDRRGSYIDSCCQHFENI